MTLRVVLEALSQRASKYCINLNDLVDRDDTFPSKHGSTAVVYQGTLRPEGIKVAIKTFHSDPSSDESGFKARLVLLHGRLPSNLTLSICDSLFSEKCIYGQNFGMKTLSVYWGLLLLSISTCPLCQNGWERETLAIMYTTDRSIPALW